MNVGNEKKQIDELIAANQAVFKSIDNMDEEHIKATTFRVLVKEHIYSAFQEENDIDVSCLVGTWKCKEEFLPIPALFSNTPSHDVKDYGELKILEEGIEKVFTAAYEFMGELIISTPVLPIFKENLEKIGKCLVDILARVNEFKSSSVSIKHPLSYYEAECEKINVLVKGLTQDNLVGIGDSPYSELFSSNLRWKTAAPNIQISEDGLQATKNSNCSYAIVAADKGWNYGTHVWYVKAKQIACYDTVGVVDESYFEQVKPLLIGLGTYPGSHRTDDGPGIKYSGHSIMKIDTIIKCKLDFMAYEFSTQIVGENDIDVFPLIEHWKKGTKLYPALTLCNNSTYRLVSQSDIDPYLRDKMAEMEINKTTRIRKGKGKKKAKKEGSESFTGSETGEEEEDQDEDLNGLF
jgi:hypothetical protein